MTNAERRVSERHTALLLRHSSLIIGHAHVRHRFRDDAARLSRLRTNLGPTSSTPSTPPFEVHGTAAGGAGRWRKRVNLSTCFPYLHSYLCAARHVESQQRYSRCLIVARTTIHARKLYSISHACRNVAAQERNNLAKCKLEVVKSRCPPPPSPPLPRSPLARFRTIASRPSC